MDHRLAGRRVRSPGPVLLAGGGFLFYLPGEQIARLLDEVTGLAHAGSWLGFDIVNTASLTHPLTRPWIDMQARLWPFPIPAPGLPGAPRHWLVTARRR